MRYVVALAAIVAAMAAGAAQAALPPYADDGGSGFYVQAREECFVAGAIETGWDPYLGKVVTLECQCSPGGTRCLWVPISGFRMSAIRTARKGEE